MRGKLSEEEQVQFLNAGRNLLSADCYYQQKEIAGLSEYLNQKIQKKKKEYQERKKIVMIFSLCIGILVVILLI